MVYHGISWLINDGRRSWSWYIMVDPWHTNPLWTTCMAPQITRLFTKEMSTALAWRRGWTVHGRWWAPSSCRASDFQRWSMLPAELFPSTKMLLLHDFIFWVGPCNRLRLILVALWHTSDDQSEYHGHLLASGSPVSQKVASGMVLHVSHKLNCVHHVCVTGRVHMGGFS